MVLTESFKSFTQGTERDFAELTLVIMIMAVMVRTRCLSVRFILTFQK